MNGSPPPRRLVLPILLLALGLAVSGGPQAPEPPPPPAGTEPAPEPIRGTVVNRGQEVWLESDGGGAWPLSAAAAGLVKYGGFRVEILDPHPTAGRMRFSRYRILAGEGGEPLEAGVRTILSVKNRRPVVDFRVLQTGEDIRFTLYLANNGDAPISMRFPSSQRYDFAVVTPDRQTTVWRWSWGQEFSLGFHDLVIMPYQELRYTERWPFLRSYIEDGEYVAFAELHCLPHGVVSELVPLVIQSTRRTALLQDFFLPMDLGHRWVYRVGETGLLMPVEITGRLRLDGHVYHAFSAFPDRLPLDTAGRLAEGDSRLIRFDPDQGRYLEWTPDGERPILAAGPDQRLLPGEEPLETDVGRFDRYLEYRERRDREWVSVATILPGVGVAEWVHPGPGESPVRLRLAGYTLDSATVAVQATQAQQPLADQVAITLRQSGGHPAVDRQFTLLSNGTWTRHEDGQPAAQGLLPARELWNLVQFADEAGLFQLRDQYGDDDIAFQPLRMELGFRVADREKTVHMRTSATDKPPQAFWRIVDRIVWLVRQLESGSAESGR